MESTTLLKRDEEGNILNEVSTWKPDDATKERIAMVQRDFQIGRDNLNRPYIELNNFNPVEAYNKFHLMFIGYVPPRSGDPDNSWRSNVVRPITMNKSQTFISHSVANILAPKVFAWNNDDEEDKATAEVLELMVDWTVENSQYIKNFIDSATAVMYSPVSITRLGYQKAVREEIDVEGVKKTIVDDIYTGFYCYNVPLPNFLISNPYESNVQKQRFVIENDYIDFWEAAAIYSENENFKYVEPGISTVFDPLTNTFYQVNPQVQLGHLVNRVQYWNHALDLMVVFLNGIPVTDVNNQNPRADKRYPYVRLIFEQLDEGRFFWGRPLAQKLWHDERYLNALYSASLDMVLLNVTPAMKQSGREQLSASAFAPGAMNQVSPGTEIDVLYQPKDFGVAFNAINMLEKNLSESSSDNLQSGNAGNKSMTARETVILQQNAERMMSNFTRNQMSMVEEFGNLLIGDILQHLTVGELDELTNNLNYKTILIKEKNVKGKNLSTTIRFTADQPQDQQIRALQLLDEIQQKNQNSTIYEVNAELIRSIKYKCYVSADTYKKNNKDLQKAMALEYYTLMSANPTIDQAYLTKRLTDEFYPGEADKFVAAQPQMPPQIPGAPGMANPISQQLSPANGMMGGNTQASAGGGMVPNSPVAM